jgi:hypothetical protein
MVMPVRTAVRTAYWRVDLTKTAQAMSRSTNTITIMGRKVRVNSRISDPLVRERRERERGRIRMAFAR